MTQLSSTPKILVIGDPRYLSTVAGIASREAAEIRLVTPDQLQVGHPTPAAPELIITLLSPKDSALPLLSCRLLFPDVPIITLPATKGIDRRFISLLKRLLPTPAPKTSPIYLPTKSAPSEQRLFQQLAEDQSAYLPQLRLTPQQLGVRFFGNLQVATSDADPQAVALSGKNRDLLAFLLYHDKRSHHQDQLAHAFWPDSAYGSRNSLQVAIHSIRNLAKRQWGIPELISFQNGCYRINPALVVMSDAKDFRGFMLSQSTDSSAGLVAAYNRYSGEFLPSLTESSWAIPIREYYLKQIVLVIQQLLPLAAQYELPAITAKLELELSTLLVPGN